MISQTSSLKYQSYDRRFDALFGVEAELKRLWSGGGWLEGPVWLPSEGQVLFSDIPNDRQLLYNSQGGRVLEHQAGHHRYANGAALCGNGDILVCEHGTRALTRTRPDGTRSIVMDHYQGARLNSPNDVVVTSDGTIWFTDPSYGIESDTHGRKAQREQPGNFVFQLLPNGELGQVLKDFAYPNGIAVSDDKKWLYVADSGGSRSPGNERHIRRYPLPDGRADGPGRVFAVCPNGVFDGFALDAGGRIWASASDGVYVYDMAGQPLGFIPLPECVSNLCFGGPANRQLYVTATSSLYLINLG